MANERVVHIIDDDEAMRGSLEFLLSTEGYQTQLHECAQAFLDALGEATVDCILTDVRMPGMSGIELLRQLRADGVTVPIIVMTGHGEVALAVEAMKAGAYDFIEKPFDDEHLLQAIAGAIALRSGNEEEDRRRAALAAALDSLSMRERQVFDALIEGKPNKVIAHALGISPRTVEIYRANVMSKLGATSLAEVIRIGFLVEGPDRPLA